MSGERQTVDASEIFRANPPNLQLLRYSVSPCSCGCGGYHVRIERNTLLRGEVHRLAVTVTFTC